jgi:hypothetical protein
MSGLLCTSAAQDGVLNSFTDTELPAEIRGILRDLDTRLYAALRELEDVKNELAARQDNDR